MTRNTYEKLCQYLYCSDVPHEENDTVQNIKDFVDTLKDNFKRMFTPGQSFTVEEALIKSSGKFVWKQYVPEVTNWGIKLMCLCDSVTGYCLNFQICEARSTNAELPQPFGLGYAVVMDLMKEHTFKKPSMSMLMISSHLSH